MFLRLFLRNEEYRSGSDVPRGMRVGTHQSEKNGNAESQAPSNADGWGLLKTQMGWRVNPHPHAAGMALPALYGGDG